MIAQSKCAVCRQRVGPGAGVVISYGAGGRVHAEKCLAIAQNRALGEFLLANGSKVVPHKRAKRAPLEAAA